MGPRSSITVLLLIFALAAVPAAAQQVGTATAVNPTSETTPPGATTVALTVGARIVHKQRIHTTPTGTVQLLFLDKSTLSIAPNTSLLIDEYVYDPNSGSGHMLTSLTEGARPRARFASSAARSVTRAKRQLRRPPPRSAFAAERSPSSMATTARGLSIILA
jgi:hypothetical protein